jgi:hypothetical protein
LLPSSGVMKPKPLSALNHLTVPVGILPPRLCAGLRGGCSLNSDYANLHC